MTAHISVTDIGTDINFCHGFLDHGQPIAKGESTGAGRRGIRESSGGRSVALGGICWFVRHRQVCRIPALPRPIVLCLGAPPSTESIFPNPPISRTASQSSRPPISPNPNPMPRSSASEIPGMPLRRQLSPLSNGSQGLFTPDVHTAAPRVGMMGNVSSWE